MRQRQNQQSRSYLLKADSDIVIQEVHLFFNEDRSEVRLDHYVLSINGKRVTVGARELLNPELHRQRLEQALEPVVIIPTAELPPQE